MPVDSERLQAEIESLEAENAQLKDAADARRARLMPDYAGPEECCSCHIAAPCTFCLDAAMREAAIKDEQDLIRLEAENSRIMSENRSMGSQIDRERAQFDEERGEWAAGYALMRQALEWVVAFFDPDRSKQPDDGEQFEEMMKEVRSALTTTPEPEPEREGALAVAFPELEAAARNILDIAVEPTDRSHSGGWTVDCESLDELEAALSPAPNAEKGE